MNTILVIFLLSAGRAAAAPAPQEAALPKKAVEAVRWVEACAADNPFGPAGALMASPTAAGRYQHWATACYEQKEPCKTVSMDEAEKALVGRCQSCIAPPPYYLPDLRKAEGAERDEPEKRIKVFRTTEGCIMRLVRRWVWEDVKSKGTKAPRAPLKAVVCGASSRAMFERNYAKSAADDYVKEGERCTATSLRNADHYLFSYCEYLENGVVRGFPNIYCSITAGYSVVKMLLGSKRGVLSTGSQDPSAPSTEEVYWGCSGIWDAQDGKLPESEEKWQTPPWAERKR
ncbi:MAG: hypothetical protein HY927_01840 [Elusimicrobia bacterium]|nr:hypothetical protein [Elusimicrobiota bacterium]